MSNSSEAFKNSERSMRMNAHTEAEIKAEALREFSEYLEGQACDAWNGGADWAKYGNAMHDAASTARAWMVDPPEDDGDV